MVTTADINWLAGFLEGEGSFMYGDNGGKAYRYKCLRIAAASTDEDVIRRAANILGANVNGPYKYQVATYKPFWRVFLTGKRAAAWMMTLYPLMGQRRKQAIAAGVTAWRTQGAPSISSVVEGGSSDKIG